MPFHPLLDYAIQHNLIAADDCTYIANLLLDLYHADAPDDLVSERPDLPEQPTLGTLLAAYITLAEHRGLIPSDSVIHQDLFAAKLMGYLTPMPAQIRQGFASRIHQSPKTATDWFYDLCRDNGYIQTDRIAKNRVWKSKSPYGTLDITINLSKPEKDPKAIAAAAAAPSVHYPQCQLCIENEGYAGRLNHPARQNLRIVPVTLQDEHWFFQYSPYAYYNEHCIVLNSEHVPMKIDRLCFAQLLEFVGKFPHYFVGSNADLPVVGGSILSHAHFQGGGYEFPMAKAECLESVTFQGFADLTCGIVHWPMSVLRVRGSDPERITELANRILTAWRSYSDPKRELYAHTGDTPHHTITPIARMRGSEYELDLVLRDNHTTPEHPLGLYHPHAELHHIKKENIGLIEVMGLAVLPARLKEELECVRQWIVAGTPDTEDERITKHAAWVHEWLPDYPADSDWAAILEQEVGNVFTKVLEHCGVYKLTEDGLAGFRQFLAAVPTT